jgi:hypothetical protein
MDRESFTFYFFIAIHFVVVVLKAVKPCANITFLTPVSRLRTLAFGWQVFSQSLNISCHCIIIVILNWFWTDMFPYIIHDTCCSISKGPIIALVLSDNCWFFPSMSSWKIIFKFITVLDEVWDSHGSDCVDCILQLINHILWRWSFLWRVIVVD